MTEKFGWQAAGIVYFWPLVLLPALFAMPEKANSTLQIKDGFRPFLVVTPIYPLLILWSIFVFAISIKGPFFAGGRGAE